MTENLTPGDLIGVAFNNYIWPAIYVKNNVGNAHFYRLEEGTLDRFRRGLKPRVEYIARNSMINDSYGRAPICRLHLESIKDKHRLIYDELKDLLKRSGKI